MNVSINFPFLDVIQDLVQRRRVDEYLNVMQNFQRTFQVWDLLPGYMQGATRQRYEQLSDAQNHCFWELCDWFHHYVDQFVGLENFGRMEVEWVWTWSVWFRVLLRQAERMCSRDLFNDNGCWLTIIGLVK